MFSGRLLLSRSFCWHSYSFLFLVLGRSPSERSCEACMNWLLFLFLLYLGDRFVNIRFDIIFHLNMGLSNAQSYSYNPKDKRSACK